MELLNENGTIVHTYIQLLNERKYSNNLSIISFQVRVYDINIPNGDIDHVWQHPTYVEAAAKEHLKVYYKMNDDTEFGK